MGPNSTAFRAPDSPIGDVAYLVRSEHRVPALIALTERPRGRPELCELTEVSSSTMRRTLAEFEDRHWVHKEGYQYAATRLGETVAAGVSDLLDLVETEQMVRDNWHWLPDEIREAPVETWTGLTTTVADPDAPYRPVGRFQSLFEQTSTLRFLRPEVALMEPSFDHLCRRIDDGVDVTLIDRPNCHAYFVSTYPEQCSNLLDSDNFTVLEARDLPAYGVGLLDECVVVTAYERESGTVQAIIDTDDPAIREWADTVYDRYAATARPFDPPRPLE